MVVRQASILGFCNDNRSRKVDYQLHAYVVGSVCFHCPKRPTVTPCCGYVSVHVHKVGEEEGDFKRSSRRRRLEKKNEEKKKT